MFAVCKKIKGFSDRGNDPGNDCEVLQNMQKNVSLYPLKFRPLYKDYIWGGRNLEKLGKKLPGGKVAESWEIAAHRDGMSVTANGPFRGRTLEELVFSLGESLTGTISHKKYKNRFPLLVKFFDANDWLSVQVHPDDVYAAVHENDSGKTEAWVVIDALPDSMIIYGFNRKMDRKELAEVIREGRLKEVLGYRRVRKGDVVYIPAGTIHAAGSGILMAEIQQSSNVTYRLYDFDRKNPDGTSRPLHIKKALDVINFGRTPVNSFMGGIRTCPSPGLAVEYLVADPHFCIQRVTIEKEAGFTADGRSFHALVAISGLGELEWDGGSLPVKAGESVLVPASLGDYRIRGRITMLKSFIGDLCRDIICPLEEQGFSPQEIKSKVAGLSNAIDAVGSEHPL